MTDTTPRNLPRLDRVPRPRPDTATGYWRTPVMAADDRLLGGVAAGLAREIGCPRWLIRLLFLATVLTGGWGAVCYALCWFAMPEAATDPVERIPKGGGRVSRLLGLALLSAGLLTLFATLPPLWIGFGIRGVLLLAGAAFVVLAVSAPWWLRLVFDRDRERQARIRSDERAEVAAHLHDSVLQTLSLIQRNADDPQKMMSLARRQERELRNWLDPDRASRVGESIRGRLDQMATDVEQLHGVPVEVVTAGDCLVDEGIAAALDATREATVNAAKHSGAEQIDVYAEVGPDQVEFFVRDAGCGFAKEAVNGDRRGLRESILGRMERVGGTAIVHSDLGEGTEVEISIARRSDAGQPPPPPPPGQTSPTQTPPSSEEQP
ncbi:MAG: PspC domain-containing protein [Actinomycetota bacterium]